MINKNGLYLCIKEPQSSLFDNTKPCYGYLFEYIGQLPKDGIITLYSVYPSKGIRVDAHPELFDQYFRDITKMTIIDHVPTNDCGMCPFSYRYHNTELLDEPEWQFFCSVDGKEADDFRDDCPAHFVKGKGCGADA